MRAAAARRLAVGPSSLLPGVGAAARRIRRDRLAVTKYTIASRTMMAVLSAGDGSAPAIPRGADRERRSGP